MKIFRKLFFNLWYYRHPPWDTGVSPPELLEFIAGHPPGKALDIGCGTGTNAIRLAKEGWKVTGVDFAARAIYLARRKASREGLRVDFRIADATELRGLEGPYNLVLDMGCFHSLSEEGMSKYIHNLDQLLAPGGIFLLYGFFRERDGRGRGFTETDLDKIGARLNLINRKDGSERGWRPSAWLTYAKPDPTRNKSIEPS